MRDLSLHILDLVDNSIRAGASEVAIAIDTDSHANALTITIDDNGHGLKVSPQQALDPFYTTKSGKKTGLGLSLFKATAERAGGQLELSASPLGGLRVCATMQVHHLDRAPMGDLAQTVCSIVCANGQLRLRMDWCLDGERLQLDSRQVAAELSSRIGKPANAVQTAMEVCDRLKKKLPALSARPVPI